jgi:hypothetical protein
MVIIHKKIVTFGYREVCVLGNLFKSFNIIVVSCILLLKIYNIYFKLDFFFKTSFLDVIAPSNWQNLAKKETLIK